MRCDSPMTLPYRGRGTSMNIHRDVRRVTKPIDSRTLLESWAAAGKSPVDEINWTLMSVPK